MGPPMSDEPVHLRFPVLDLWGPGCAETHHGMNAVGCGDCLDSRMWNEAVLADALAMAQAEIEQLKADRLALAERVRSMCVNVAHASMAEFELTPYCEKTILDEVRSLDLSALTSEQGS